MTYAPVDFQDLPEWTDDDQLAAFHTLLQSCRRIVSRDDAAPGESAGPGLRAACADALVAAPNVQTTAAARAFFERRFRPHRVVHTGPPGLLTGYFEPVIDGARTPSAHFPVPIHARPPDLVNLVDETRRGTMGHTLTHARKTPAGLVPFPARAEIDAGALAGQGLELFYLRDAVDVFFLQVQGSGLILLPDATHVRVTYDGKNGHPYTSIGRHLIDSGAIDADRMSLQTLGAWLRADAQRGLATMHRNQSYVFFKPLSGASAPLGVLDNPLTSGRSLAVDAGIHQLGLPVYVSAPTLRHATTDGGFHRLMIAQDVGSAIKGPERGDIFFGSGDAAGELAGVTKHPGRFFVLLPRDTPAVRALP